jgi:hypothetical protein
VSAHVCSQVLHLHLCTLDFLTEPPVDYPDSNSGDVTFIKATSAIEGRDTVEEYLVYGEAIARWLTTEAKHRLEVL